MLVGLVVHSSPVLVLWYGVHQILKDQLTVGELTQFLLYLAMFYFPLQRLSDLSVVLVNALAAIERIFEYFDTQPHAVEKPNARPISYCQGRIEFDHVHFSYDPGTPVLHDISLTLEALSRLLEGRTSIVIAHRLSTILNADRIAVIEAGRLVEIGSHAALLSRGGLYAQLYNEQFHHLRLLTKTG